jgi:hypothetical protein
MRGTPRQNSSLGHPPDLGGNQRRIHQDDDGRWLPDLTLRTAPVRQAPRRICGDGGKPAFAECRPPECPCGLSVSFSGIFQGVSALRLDEGGARLNCNSAVKML